MPVLILNDWILTDWFLEHGLPCVAWCWGRFFVAW